MIRISSDCASVNGGSPIAFPNLGRPCGSAFPRVASLRSGRPGLCALPCCLAILAARLPPQCSAYAPLSCHPICQVCLTAFGPSPPDVKVMVTSWRSLFRKEFSSENRLQRIEAAKPPRYASSHGRKGPTAPICLAPRRERARPGANPSAGRAFRLPLPPNP